MGKSSRDEFTAKTKRDLAARAGYLCSFPECDHSTSGPGAESPHSTVNIGEACHIRAAASGPGARRYDPSMTSGERRAIDNGIWMCRTHAKLIDSDEATYTVELLLRWKRQAAARAGHGVRGGSAVARLTSRLHEAAFQPLLAGLRGGSGSTQEARRGSAFPRRRRLGIKIGILGALLTTLAWIFPIGPAEPDPEPLPDLYSLRVQILEPTGRPVRGTSVRTSAGNEPHLLPDGWWQIEIPRAKLPLDGQIVVWAEHSDWNSARQTLQLAEDPNPRLEIRLEVPKERIAGIVVDVEGRGVEGARLSLRDHAGSSTATDRDGRFELWVTAARHHTARVHIEHAEFRPKDGSCFVGRDGCSLVLERK